MKRSVQKDTELSVYTQAEFLNFLFILFFQKAKSKDLADFANTSKPVDSALIALFAIAIVPVAQVSEKNGF